MSTIDQQRDRVTVIGPFGQHQADLPMNVPVSALLPDLLAMAGLSPSPSRIAADVWQLAAAGGRALAPDGTLAGQGIRPGAIVELRERRPGTAGPDDDPGPAQSRTGHGILGRDTALLTRRTPRAAAPSAPPPDNLSPLQRVEAVLPDTVRRTTRIAAATDAFFRRASWPSAAADLEEAPAEVTSPDDGQPESADGTGLASADPDQVAAQRPTAAGQPAVTARHQPGRHRLMPADLTIAARPTRMESARARWRELDQLSRLDARVTGPRLQHCATIAVVSPKGGVGKTTVTALLGTLFSLLRRDPTVAVDTNPDFGSLGRVLTPDQTWYVDDLARLVDDDDELSLTGLESQLGRATHGLLVVPAPTDPERMAAIDEGAYRRVITRLKDFFSLILLDCGTGLQDPGSVAAIACADQVILITDAQPATASLVAESAELLHQSGRPITVVVNRMPPKGSRLDLDQLSRYLPAARGLIVIPDDVVAASRLAVGSFHWRDAPASWQLAVRRLAAVLVSDWARLGLAR